MLSFTQGSELISKRTSPPSDKIESPVIAFVALERHNAIRLVQTVHYSLASLNRVLRGSSLLTPAVQKLASSLLRNEVNCYCVVYVMYNVFVQYNVRVITTSTPPRMLGIIVLPIPTSGSPVLV